MVEEIILTRGYSQVKRRGLGPDHRGYEPGPKLVKEVGNETTPLLI